MDRANFTFKKVFFITTLAMHINRSHPSIRRNLFWFLQFLLIISLTSTSFVFLVNSVLFYDIPAGRFTEASKNATMSIVALTINLKYIFLLYFQSDMNKIIDIMNKDYEMAMDYEIYEKEIVENYAKRGTRVSLFWLVATAVTSSLFPIKATTKMITSYLDGEFEYVLMFDMRFPDRVEAVKFGPTMFSVLFILAFFFGCYSTTMYAGFDPLVPIFLLHICGQLDILSHRIRAVFLQKDDSTNNHENIEEINKKLKYINMKLQNMYWLIDIIKTKFSLLFEFNMKTTTFLLPLALFQVVEDLKQKSLNLEFITFFTATCCHFYMPCYYSDVLLERSANLREAIYSCGWEKHPDTRARKTILLMLTRTTAPLVLSTVFYPICLDTFAEMCRQSYALFNIMNAAWA